MLHSLARRKRGLNISGWLSVADPSTKDVARLRKLAKTNRQGIGAKELAEGLATSFPLFSTNFPAPLFDEALRGLLGHLRCTHKQFDEETLELLLLLTADTKHLGLEIDDKEPLHIRREKVRSLISLAFGVHCKNIAERTLPENTVVRVAQNLGWLPRRAQMSVRPHIAYSSIVHYAQSDGSPLCSTRLQLQTPTYAPLIESSIAPEVNCVLCKELVDEKTNFMFDNVKMWPELKRTFSNAFQESYDMEAHMQSDASNIYEPSHRAAAIALLSTWEIIHPALQSQTYLCVDTDLQFKSELIEPLTAILCSNQTPGEINKSITDLLRFHQASKGVIPSNQKQRFAAAKAGFPTLQAALEEQNVELLHTVSFFDTARTTSTPTRFTEILVAYEKLLADDMIPGTTHARQHQKEQAVAAVAAAKDANSNLDEALAARVEAQLIEEANCFSFNAGAPFAWLMRTLQKLEEFPETLDDFNEMERQHMEGVFGNGIKVNSYKSKLFELLGCGLSWDPNEELVPFCGPIPNPEEVFQQGRVS